MLDEVGLPLNALERYPHEFSGGQRQRIGLARALMLEPKVIVADEPVSALDVSIRSQVLNLMKRLQAEYQMASIVISHDLAVVKYLADRIGVMYLGKLVEIGSGEDIYLRAGAPLHRGVDQDDPGARPRGREGQDRGRDPRRAAEPDQPAAADAGFAPVARGRSRSAPRWSRRCARSARVTVRPVTSRCRRPRRATRRPGRLGVVGPDSPPISRRRTRPSARSPSDSPSAA